ncbi:MAG: biotin--[acetyl-CoA-carboxylase] ligase [Bryobacteraceae bacterium]|jgi:BirA family biotin operon repressor/biotin-[acetyl-CoA-carboxylase] ligase
MIVWFESCASTQIEAARLARQGCPSGAVVGADEQTAGYGRQGRAWHSERGSGLYVSIVLRLAIPPGSFPVLSLALGLATAESIANSTGLTCDLRWPNDVLVGEKKCAGVLVETERPAFIAGIGINVNQSAFPEDIAELATSLRLASGRPHSRDQLLTNLLESVDRFTAILVDEGRDAIIEAFSRASSYVQGKRVVVDTMEGVTDGLDPSGFLYLRRPDGARTLILAGGLRPAG